MNIAQQASAQEARQVSAADEDIRVRAYAIWEDEGRPEGRHLEHWRRAIDEVAAPAVTEAPTNGVKAPARRATKADTTGRVELRREIDEIAAPKKTPAPNNGAKPAARRAAKESGGETRRAR